MLGFISALNVVCLSVAQNMPVLVPGPKDHPSPSMSPACSSVCCSVEVYAFVAPFFSLSVPLVAVLEDMEGWLNIRDLVQDLSMNLEGFRQRKPSKI